MDRLPPQDLDAEAALLGSLLLEPACRSFVCRTIRTPEAFYREDHRRLFSAIVAMCDEFGAGGWDLVTCRNWLEARNQMDAVGGLENLIQMTESTPSAVHAESYARVLWQKHLLRGLLSITNRCVDGVHGLAWSDDVGQYLYGIAAEISALAAQGVTRRSSLHEIVADAIAEIETESEVRFRWQYELLDSILHPLEPGDFAVIGARPSHGKTTIALNIAVRMVRSGIKVAMYSLEVPARKLMRHIACMVQEVADSALAGNGHLSPDDRAAQLHTVTRKIDDKLLWIVDDCRDCGRIVADIAARKRRDGIAVAFVDYLQLIRPSEKLSHRDLFLEVTLVSQAMKAVAMAEGVALIGLAQLNREVEKRQDKMPELADLKQSGQIEQDADFVLLLTRPEKYTAGKEAGKLIVLREKVRDGPAGGAFRMGFDGRRHMIYDLPKREWAYGSGQEAIEEAEAIAAEGDTRWAY